jgi:hypothetical protein
MAMACAIPKGLGAAGILGFESVWRLLQLTTNIQTERRKLNRSLFRNLCLFLFGPKDTPLTPEFN